MIEMMNKYCNSLTEYSRYKTREVYVGKVPLGGNNPIRIQSMTITDTMNTKATVEQTIRMVDVGCEYVRITAPSMNEAKNLENIKNELRKRGYTVPLIADIHFTPNAAELAARLVEKVRVNPGNYADKKKFESIDYSDESYGIELERIREKFENYKFDFLKNKKITASFGISESEEGLTSESMVLERADNALYSAKRNGRNRVMVYI